MTGMVLLVACVNLANLMLARASARQREVAVRIAIGASRRRVVSQFLTEGMVLALLGGTLGVWLSNGISHGLISLLNTEGEPMLIDISQDWRVLVFTAAVATSSCLLFALIPALRSLRVQPLAAINGGGGRGMTLDRDRFSIHRPLNGNRRVRKLRAWLASDPHRSNESVARGLTLLCTLGCWTSSTTRTSTAALAARGESSPAISPAD